MDNDLQMLLCDAQTSGGLLIAVPEHKSKELLALLHKNGVNSAQIIGKVIPAIEKVIYVD